MRTALQTVVDAFVPHTLLSWSFFFFGRGGETGLFKNSCTTINASFSVQISCSDVLKLLTMKGFTKNISIQFHPGSYIHTVQNMH